jgi:16S rRNA C967 or C1407 C5-methylase (RsmB/RsmF family)
MSNMIYNKVISFGGPVPEEDEDED